MTPSTIPRDTSFAKALPAGMKVVDPLSFARVGGVLAIVALIAALVPCMEGFSYQSEYCLKI
jgi:hypothetical protein